MRIVDYRVQQIQGTQVAQLVHEDYVNLFRWRQSLTQL